MLSLSIIFLPVHQAQAIVFLPGVAVLAEYMGASASLATAIDASAALHAAILFIGFNSANTASPVAADMPLTVRLNPNAPLAVPSGWTAGAGGAQPVPPSTASGVATYSYDMNYGGVHGTGSTVVAACAALVQWSVNAGYSGMTCTGTETTFHLENMPNSATGSHYDGATVKSVVGSTCPTGYTVSGSSCVLSNPQLVPKPADGKCTLIGSGSAPVPDSRDPDCAGLAAAFSGSTSTTLADGTKVTHGADGTLSIARPDGTWATLNTNSNLETTVIEHYPNAATGMTTNYQTNLSSPDSTTGVSTITGSASGTSQGIGSAAGTVSSGASSSTFDKTGLATIDGQDLTNNKLDVTNNKLTGISLQLATSLDTNGAVTGLSPDDANKVAKATSDMAAVTSSLTGIATAADVVPLDNNFFASPFPNSAGCSPWTMTWSDALTGSHTLTLDLCPQQDVIQRVSGWVLYILTIATIFSMFITT